MENPKSMFYSLVEQTGPIVATHLTELAKQVKLFKLLNSELKQKYLGDFVSPYRLLNKGAERVQTQRI